MSKSHLAKIKLDEIKVLLKSGQITYSEAREMAVVPLKVLNEEMKKISAKYKRRHNEVSFAQFMR